MAKLTLNNLITLANDVSAISLINLNSSATVAALENTLSRDGTLPNQMLADIDLNSNDLLNVGEIGVNDVDANVVDANTITATTVNALAHLQINGVDVALGPLGGGLPSGGTGGQILSKIDSVNYNATWVTPAVGGTGTVTNFSIVALNGFSGSVTNSTTTPALTITTTITGMLKGNGSALLAAVANTDFQSAITLTTTGTSGAATFNGTTLNIPNYASGGDASTNTATSVDSEIALFSSTTGKLLKRATGTGIAKVTSGVLGVAIAGDFPTLNQNTSGTAASFTGSLVGDVSGTQGATVVTKINGVSMAGLATGILKNTTTTGVPSIAINSDLPVMSSTVGGAVPTPPNNTTTFLRGDGTFTAPPSSLLNSPIINLGMAFSVASNALTASIKQADGSTNPAAFPASVIVPMRSATLSSGAFNQRSITGALSLVVPSAATLGHTSNILGILYWYLLDNAGTLEIAVSSTDFGDNGLVSTTAISSSSTQSTVMYSTTARTSLPFRKIVQTSDLQAVAGTWSVVPSSTTLLTFPLNTVPQQTVRQIATGTRISGANSVPNTKANSRSRHFMRDSVTSFNLVFANWYVNSSLVETNAGGTMTLSASVEYPVGTYTQVLFSASSTIVLADGATVVSDAVAINIPDGAEFFVNSFQSISSGIVFTLSDGVDIANGEKFEYGTVLADKTMSGGVVDQGTGILFPPVAIIGLSNRPAVLVMGDSRTDGAGGDTYDDKSGNIGNLNRSLGPRYACLTIARTADSLQKFVASHAKRVLLFPYVTHAVIALGINDYTGRTALQMKGDVESIIGYLTSNGVFVWVATVEPQSTSSDAWATVGNQTTNANNGVRITYNGYIRTLALSGQSGYLELADTVEAVRDGGKWKAPGYTTDGLHATLLGNNMVRDSHLVDPGWLVIPSSLGYRFATKTESISGVASNVISTPLSVAQQIAAQAEQLSILTTDFTGTNVATAQPVFSTAQDVFAVSALTTYEFEASYEIDTTGATSHTIATLFALGGGASLTSISYMALLTNSATSGTPVAPLMTRVAVATVTVISNAVATATQHNIYLRGIIRVNAAGNITPQFQYSAAPGATPTIKANTFFRIWPVGVNTMAVIGNWS